MKIKISMLSGLFAVSLIVSGCTYQRTGTSSMSQLDGSKVDYANMEKYKTSTSCTKVGSHEDSSLSVFETAKKAGISKVVYVDQSVTKDLVCVIVYGE